MQIVTTRGEALRLCGRQPFVFDVILCDLGLPDGSGMDVAPAARAAARAAHASVRLIAVTGDGMPQDVRDIESAGFDARVLKPFQIDQLLQLLR